MIYNSHGFLVLEKVGGLGIDFAYTAMPKVSDTQIDIYLNGTIFNNSFGLISPMEGYGDLLIDAGTTDTVQVDVSQYMVESLFLTLQESGDLQVYIDDAMIPPTSAFNLTTTSLDELLPGLVEKYGADLPMGIALSS